MIKIEAATRLMAAKGTEIAKIAKKKIEVGKLVRKLWSDDSFWKKNEDNSGWATMEAVAKLCDIPNTDNYGNLKDGVFVDSDTDWDKLVVFNDDFGNELRVKVPAK